MTSAPSAKTIVVLTGGPQGGKSTLLRRLGEDDQVKHLLTVVPEAATMIFGGGHPTPGPSWGDNEWYCLQLAITSLQISLEESLGGRTPLTICDRAPFDNLSYSFGRQALRHLWGEDFALQLARYDLVVHMESLATAGPDLFGRLDNADRYEDLAEAQALEMRARQAWEGHPNWHFVSGAQRPFEDKLAEASALVKAQLSRAGTV